MPLLPGRCIIQSPHKTLPSLTQTALLHWNSSFIPPQELERQLDVFETSSPSYPLMASLDGCTGLLAEHGDAWFAAWRARLQRFSGAVRPLRRLRVLCHGMDDVSAHPGFFAHDSGKILVNGAAAGLTGPALAELLRRDWQFETEMSCGANVLAMTSPCDEETALDRFAAALLVIDAAAAQNAPCPPRRRCCPPPAQPPVPSHRRFLPRTPRWHCNMPLATPRRSMSGHIRRAFRCWHRAK